ncbi:MAG: septum formation protein Maf [Tissierellia bacterium]|nr:septum formation protein Maf [Tissierellia bacterium]
MNTKIILASSSPRRMDLIKLISKDVIVKPSSVEENGNSEYGFPAMAMGLAFSKAINISEAYENEIVIGADTIVVHDNKVMGKPSNRQEAFEMLKELSNNSHEVITGFAIIQKSKNRKVVNYSKTIVAFDEYSYDEINRYLNSGEYFDKAGAYGIQGAFGVHVKNINGSYYNVVGLPIDLVYRTLREEFDYVANE